MVGFPAVPSTHNLTNCQIDKKLVSSISSLVNNRVRLGSTLSTWDSRLVRKCR